MKNFFYIIKHDRQASITLLIVFVAIGVIVLEFCTPQKTASPKDDDLVSWKENDTKKGERDQYYAVQAKEIHLQKFDPNTADSTVLLGLGLQPWQVRSIYKYRAAGGVYTRPEDFARLYGLSRKKYRELRPYIVIGEDYRPASEGMNYQHNSPSTGYSNNSTTTAGTYAEEIPTDNSSKEWPTKLKAGQTIDINSADTNALKRVPGIGPYFARKIARYSEMLGGFVNKDQLLEIEGFPESALPYLVIDSDRIHKLNINKATAEQLRKHPYITYMMARQIMDYRRLRGNIQNINDLSLLPNFTKETINKLRPYIEY